MQTVKTGSLKAPEWREELREAATEARCLAASFADEAAARDLKAFAAALERDACLGRLAATFKDETVPSV
jgi:hypothetical protein